MRAIVVYFSLSGHTKYAAEAVATKLGAEILRLETKRPYPKARAVQMVVGGFGAVFGRARRLKQYRFGKNKYDLVVLATPVWASRIAPPMKRFLKEHELGDLSVGLIACSGGGNAQGAMDMMKAKAKNAVAELSLIDPSAKDAAKSRAAIDEFCGKLKARHGV
jgi:flavodoxin